MTPDAEDLMPLAEQAAGLLKALAHPARLMICCQLRGREMSVGDIEQTLGIAQPRLSRELGKLREAGLLATRRQSKVVFYRLADPRADRIVAALCLAMRGDGCPAAAQPPDPVPDPIPAPAPDHRPESLATRPGGYGVFARTGPLE